MMNVDADFFQVEAEEVEVDGLAFKFASSLSVLDAVGYGFPILRLGRATEDTKGTEEADQTAVY